MVNFLIVNVNDHGEVMNYEVEKLARNDTQFTFSNVKF